MSMFCLCLLTLCPAVRWLSGRHTIVSDTSDKGTVWYVYHLTHIYPLSNSLPQAIFTLSHVFFSHPHVTEEESAPKVDPQEKFYMVLLPGCYLRLTLRCLVYGLLVRKMFTSGKKICTRYQESSDGSVRE